MPVAISLDAIGEPGEVRVTKNLCPTGQVESGLRSEIWKLDSDRHEGNDTPKTKVCTPTTGHFDFRLGLSRSCALTVHPICGGFRALHSLPSFFNA